MVNIRIRVMDGGLAVGVMGVVILGIKYWNGMYGRDEL
jgi:hypothetical protein